MEGQELKKVLKIVIDSVVRDHLWGPGLSRHATKEALVADDNQRCCWQPGSGN